MKKENIAMIIAALLFLFVLVYILSHSEGFVTYKDFYIGLIGLASAVFTGFWGIWSKISTMNKEIGKILGYLEGIKETRMKRKKRKI